MFNNIVTLKSGLEVTPDDSKLVPFESLGAASYSPSIVMSLFCIISEIKRDIGRKSFFSYSLAFDAPLGGFP